jgi:hypothetical protein
MIFTRYFAAFVIVVVFLIGLCNFINQMHHADHKEFWLDEKFSLKNTIQNNTYLGLLGKADVRSEANTAPLDYIATKILDDIKRPVNAFGLSDKIYYRLWANFVMVFSGFLIVCLFVREILRSPVSNSVRIFQLILLLFLPFVYLYRPMTYYYAAEVRPYALWFALWFLCIGICSMPRSNKFILTVCLSLLAMTMVGSIFQLLALAIAYAVVQCLQHGWKQALKDSFQVFTIPLFVVVFYAYPAAYGDRSSVPPSVAWYHFYDLWGHEAIVIPMLLVTITSLYLSKRTQPMIIGSLAVLIVFLMGPLICGITLGRGYFFTERQYIYYDANRAIFWLGLINMMPFYLEKIKDHKKQILVMAIIVALSIPFVFLKKTIIYIREVYRGCMKI